MLLPVTKGSKIKTNKTRAGKYSTVFEV